MDILFEPLAMKAFLVMGLGVGLILLAQMFAPRHQPPVLTPTSDLLRRLDALPLSEFAHLMVLLLERMGLRVEGVRLLRDAVTDGVAIVAVYEHEVLRGTCAAYCLRGADRSVGVEWVHHLRRFAKEHNALKALLITTGTFRQDALHLPNVVPMTPTEFVDGERLTEWLTEHLSGEIAQLPPAPTEGTPEV